MGADDVLPPGLGHVLVYGFVAVAVLLLDGLDQVGFRHIPVVGKGAEQGGHLQGGDQGLALAVAAFRQEHQAQLRVLVMDLGAGHRQVEGQAGAQAHLLHIGFKLVPAHEQGGVGKVDVIGIYDAAVHIQVGQIPVFDGCPLDLAAHPGAKFRGQPVIVLDLPFKHIVFIQGARIQGRGRGKGLEHGAGRILALGQPVVKGGIALAGKLGVIRAGDAPGKQVQIIAGPAGHGLDRPGLGVHHDHRPGGLLVHEEAFQHEIQPLLQLHVDGQVQVHAVFHRLGI